MSAPAITIAIPFCNEERHLATAVRSVLRQTFTDFELLLVDDGSTDGSLAIARSFDDPRIRVIAEGEHRGLPARLNLVVEQARGDLVARMDADDVIHPTRLARQVEYLRADPQCDVVGTWCGLVDDDDQVFGVTEAGTPSPTPKTAVVAGVLAHATILARRAWLRAHRYDESLSRAEDRDLWIRTVERTRFGVVTEPLYVVRISVRDPRFVGKYARSQRENRLLALRHGPAIMGWPSTLRFCAATYAKTSLVRAAHLAGLSGRIVRRRGRSPTEKELAMIREALSSSAQRP